MIITGAIVERIATRKDKTAAITIGTQELNPKLASDLFGLMQTYCYVGFKSESFTTKEIDEIEKIKTDIPNLKTPSQRLRAVLFLNFQTDPKGYETFDSYYMAKMEQIIEHFKNSINGI
jgi:hypothetical protein